MNEVAESPTYDRPKLLPRLGVLGGINVLAALIAYFPFAFFFIALLSVGYLGVTILRTRDLVSGGDRLHPSDRWICRKSGVLAASLAATLFMGACLAMSGDKGPEDIGLETAWGMALVGFIMEIGVVLSVACLCAPKELRHARPHTLWRAAAIPLLLIYGAYVVFLMWTPIITLMRQE